MTSAVSFSLSGSQTAMRRLNVAVEEIVTSDQLASGAKDLGSEHVSRTGAYLIDWYVNAGSKVHHFDVAEGCP